MDGVTLFYGRIALDGSSCVRLTALRWLAHRSEWVRSHVFAGTETVEFDGVCVTRIYYAGPFWSHTPMWRVVEWWRG